MVKNYTIHYVKCWPSIFEVMKSEDKLFDIRKDDRDYKKGDIIVQQEYNQITETYTGRENAFKIKWCLRNASEFGLMDGYVAMSLTPFFTIKIFNYILYIRKDILKTIFK